MQKVINFKKPSNFHRELEEFENDLNNIKHVQSNNCIKKNHILNLVSDLLSISNISTKDREYALTIMFTHTGMEDVVT